MGGIHLYLKDESCLFLGDSQKGKFLSSWHQMEFAFPLRVHLLMPLAWFQQTQTKQKGNTSPLAVFYLGDHNPQLKTDLWAQQRFWNFSQLNLNATKVIKMHFMHKAPAEKNLTAAQLFIHPVCGTYRRDVLSRSLQVCTAQCQLSFAMREAWVTWLLRPDSGIRCSVRREIDSRTLLPPANKTHLALLSFL